MIFTNATAHYEFWLPLPPSVNRYYFNAKSTGRGHRGRIKTTAAQEWERECILRCRHHFTPIKPPHGQRFGVEYFFVYPKSMIWRCDCNNYEKHALDIICKMSGLDDRYEVLTVRHKQIGDVPQIVGTLFLLPTDDASRCKTE